MNVYTTIDELKKFLGGGLEEGIEETDDDTFKRFCIEASRAFDTWVSHGVYPKRRFYPYVATKVFDHPADIRTLALLDDLLQVTTFTTENGSVSLAATDYVLATGAGNYNYTPYQKVMLREDAAVTGFSFSGTRLQANQIVGIWGYHNDWANAWEDSQDTVQDDPLAIGATSITVQEADGEDVNGLSNRFKVQQLLRIEDEYLWLIDIEYGDTTDNLVVRRGMNGTAAAAHAQGTPIEIYRPMDEIRGAMTALAAFLYQRRDSIGTVDDRPLATSDGILVMPATLPEEVKLMLKPYRKERL